MAFVYSIEQTKEQFDFAQNKIEVILNDLKGWKDSAEEFYKSAASALNSIDSKETEEVVELGLANVEQLLPVGTTTGSKIISCIQGVWTILTPLPQAISELSAQLKLCSDLLLKISNNTIDLGNLKTTTDIIQTIVLKNGVKLDNADTHLSGIHDNLQFIDNNIEKLGESITPVCKETNVVIKQTLAAVTVLESAGGSWFGDHTGTWKVGYSEDETAHPITEREVTVEKETQTGKKETKKRRTTIGYWNKFFRRKATAEEEKASDNEEKRPH
jgi:archaellum component FlaC